MNGIGIAKGMLVTLTHLFRKPFTVQYPEEEVPRYPRFRGQEFVWYEERCTGCAACAKFCPLGIIRIVTATTGKDAPEGGRYDIEVFDIDGGRCMYCGLCVEACPYDALFMGSHFERAKDSRRDLVITVDELRAGSKAPSTYFRPQLEAKGYDPSLAGPLSPEEVGR